MVRAHLYLSKGNVVLLRNINKECPDPLLDLTLQHIAPVLGRPDQVGEGIVNSMGVCVGGPYRHYTPFNLSLAGDSMSAANDTHSPPPPAAGQPERFSHNFSCRAQVMVVSCTNY